jgi:hypothetical protein
MSERSQRVMSGLITIDASDNKHMATQKSAAHHCEEHLK